MASGHSFCSCGDSFLSAQTEPVFSKRHRQMVTIPPLPVCHTNTIYACGLPSSVVCFRRRLLLSLDFVVNVFLSSLLYDFLFISSQRHNFHTHSDTFYNSQFIGRWCVVEGKMSSKHFITTMVTPPSMTFTPLISGVLY